MNGEFQWAGGARDVECGERKNRSRKWISELKRKAWKRTVGQVEVKLIDIYGKK